MSAYSNDFVTSADGTKIGYRMSGQGPGVVLVQGAMGTAENYDELARLLAPNFTLYLPDRRGRGMSPLRYTHVHMIPRDIEDLDALLTQCGAHYVFGLSSGAIIALAAAAALPSIKKTALYEPPFYPEGISHAAIERFNQEVQLGSLAAALVTVSKLVKLGPKLLALIPRPLLRLATSMVLKREARLGPGRYASLRELIPAMRYDFKIVAGMDGQLPTFASLGKEVLLLGGGRSPTYLKTALMSLAQVLPNTHCIEFEGLDHSGPWNADRGGHPEPIACALRDFFV